jgi:hypothetical protein
MTVLGTLRPHGKSWAGLAAGPACWAIGTQLNYALVPQACGGGSSIFAIIATALGIISLAGALWSWFAWGRDRAPGLHMPKQDGHPHDLLCGLGVGSGVLFAMVVAIQGVASLILDPCLR